MPKKHGASLHESVTRCLGLVSQYSPLNVAPGALIKADNIVIRRENIAEDRRGYASYGTLSNSPTQLFTYLSRVLAHNGTAISYDNGSGTFADYSGTYSAPGGQKIRSVEAFKNLYITTSSGVSVLTDVAGTAGRFAGSPRSLDPDYALTGSSGYLSTTSQTAYRVVLVRTDANNNILYGYPSNRMWVLNTSGGSRGVSITVYFPSEIANADASQYTVQVYRAGTQTAYVSANGDEAGDDMHLVYQYTPTSSDITTGNFTFVDALVDTLAALGPALYTNAAQEGILQANDRPPLAKDIALFKNTLFFANCETKQRLQATLVGTASIGITTASVTNGTTAVTGITQGSAQVGWKITGAGVPANTTVTAITATTLSASNSITAGTPTLTLITNQTITLAGQSYSFANTETPASGIVGVSVTGVAATDIDLTTRSFVRAINRLSSNTLIYAYYQSSSADLPGKMLFESRLVGASIFTIQSSNAAIQAMFSPLPPVSPATSAASTSTSSIQPNALYYSKTQQVEAVPTLNYLNVGSANKNILRIAPLRDSLIIIKEEGIFVLRGESAGNFTIQPLDLTVFCKSADSVAVLANLVFLLSNQGIVAVSDTGVQVVSREIEPDVLPLISYSGISSYASGCSYESDRSYLLSVMTNSGDTAQNQIYVYNVFTKTWVHWTFGFSAAIVEPVTDKLYFSKPSSAIVYRERKSFTQDDYADPEYDVTITSISGNTIQLTSASIAPQVGWVISQGGTNIAIQSLSTHLLDFTAVLQDVPPGTWATGAAKMYPSVGMEIIWDNWTGQGAVGMLKQARELAIFSDNVSSSNSETSVVPTFTSNFDSSREECQINFTAGGWGGGAWGAIPWGGTGASYGYRAFVPRDKQFCSFLNPGVRHKNALEKLAVAGFAVSFEVLSDRIGKNG